MADRAGNLFGALEFNQTAKDRRSALVACALPVFGGGQINRAGQEFDRGAAGSGYGRSG